jgi:pimeloyl-ACP methyl ester carboxylesterase
MHALSLTLLVALVACAPPIQRQELTIQSGDVSLGATLVAPTSQEKLPAVVVLHGSGDDSRANQYYWLLADEFNRRGFAVLLYDKRGSGASTGNWRQAPFSAVIDDAVAAAAALRRHPSIDSTRVGVWGGSEGATIAPEVAARAGLAFVVMQSGPTVTFAEQNLHQTRLQVQGMTSDSAQQEAAMRMQRLKHQIARSGNGWEEFQTMMAAAAGTPYAGLAGPSSRNDYWWSWYRTKLDYTPIPFLEKLRVPVLAIWGSADILVPVERSRVAFDQARRPLQVPGDSAVVIEGADHTLYINGLRGILRRGLRNRPVTLDLAADWAARQISR